MKKLILPMHPKAAAQKALRLLPNRRLRDVLERRYGISRGKKETLEAIGKSYGITRERVRQIEEDALGRLHAAKATLVLEPIFSALDKHLEDHGGVSEEQKLFSSIAGDRVHSQISFLLTLTDSFDRKIENDRFHNRWYTKDEALKAAETILQRTEAELEERRKPVSAEELFSMLKNHVRNTLGLNPTPDMLDSFLGISKSIKQNPYGEFGLVSWPTINPLGVRDKAYAVLARLERPLHFRDVATAIDKAGWDRKKAHPQTVHNELIKDDRFVLVGRGLYALKEWGYEPGTVADVIMSILKKAGRPLNRQEIIKKVLEKRMVKENTILLNLQNRKRFKKIGDDLALV